MSQRWSLYLLGVLVCCIVNLPAVVYTAATDTAKDQDCIQLPAHEGQGELIIPNINASTCYNISLINLTDKIYIQVDPDNHLSPSTGVGDPEADGSNVTVMSIYNIRNGSQHLISKRNLTGSYLAVGYTESSVNHSTPVMMMILRTSANLVTSNVIVAQICDLACRITMNPPPAELTLPDTESGLALTLDYTLTFGGGATSQMYAFTLFNIGSDGSSIGFRYHSTDVLFAIFNGTELPPDFLSQTTTVQLKLRTAKKAEEGDSFSALLTTPTPGCTGELVVPKSGEPLEITSPGYPHQYSNGLLCKIVVRAPHQHQKLIVKALDASFAADADRVMLRDGGSSRSDESYLIASIDSEYSLASGSDVVRSFMTSSDSLMFRFYTDELGTSRGFKFNVSYTEVNGMYRTPDNLVFSPAFRPGYPNYRVDNNKGVTSFMIQAPLNEQVRIELVNMTLLPAAYFVCYDYDTDTWRKTSPVALYRTNLLRYAANSAVWRMWCDGVNFTPGQDMIEITTSSISSDVSSRYKYSTSISDTYNLDETLEDSNATYTWIIQPDSYTDQSVIELLISKLTLPSSPSHLLIQIQSLSAVPYATLSADTDLPYVLRAPASEALRLSITYTIPANYSTSTLDTLSLISSYSTKTLSTHVNVTDVSSGVLTSPYYPHVSVQNLDKSWLFDVPANSSFLFSFDSHFNLANGSILRIYSDSDKTGPVATTTYLQVNGSSTVPPADLIVNNTKSNSSLAVSVHYTSANHNNAAGFKLHYETLDDGGEFNLDLGVITHIHTGEQLNSSFHGVFVFKYPPTAITSIIQMSANISFTPNKATTLTVRDGGYSYSPLLNNTGRVNASSNLLYVRYSYTPTDSDLALSKPIPPSPITMYISPIWCGKERQCRDQTNTTVCMPYKWRCDNIYQCLDGADEAGCHATPAPSTSSPPATTATGAAWWVFGVCVAAAFVVGMVGAIVMVTLIMRRRGAGYGRLSELMTPVPT